ncbi:MAG: hypothetical protein RLZZ323_1637 [Bacteroidota bacterium]|jgi:hypothetical protein
MRHELKFKPALVTLILLLAIYWPLAFIMALLGFGMAWDGSKNWLMNAFNKIFHLTPYSMVLNWLIFSIIGGGLVFLITNRSFIFKNSGKLGKYAASDQDHPQDIIG